MKITDNLEFLSSELGYLVYTHKPERLHEENYDEIVGIFRDFLINANDKLILTFLDYNGEQLSATSR